MIIQNSIKVLAELTQVERDIVLVEQFINKQSLEIDSEKLLEEIFEIYCGER